VSDPQPEASTFGPGFWFVVATSPVTAVDVSIIDALLPDIVKDLGISVGDASLVDAMTVTVAGALMVPAGKLGDLIGAKRVLLVGLVMAILGNLATGFANGLGMLMAGRVLQGAAFSMALPMAIATLNHDFPQGPDRRRAFALFMAAGVGSIGLAPIIGASIADHFSWRWAFLMVAPLAAIILAGIYRFVPAVPDGTPTKSFDAPGIVLLVLALGLALFSIQQGSRYGWWRAAEGIELFGRPWPFALSPTPVLLLIAATLVGVLLLIEQRRAREKLDVVVDLRLFEVRSFVWGTFALAFSSAASLGALLIVSLYAEYVLGASQVTAGSIVMPLGLAVLVTGPIGSRLAQVPGRTVGVLSLGAQLLAVVVLIAASTPQGWPAAMGAAMFVLGVAWVLSLSSLTSVILADVPAPLAGEAAGMQSATRFLICGFAMVVMTTLLLSVTAFQTQKIGLAGLSPADRTTIDAVERLTRPAALRPTGGAGDAAEKIEGERYDRALAEVRGDISEGIRGAGLLTVLMLAIGMIAAWRLPRASPVAVSPHKA